MYNYPLSLVINFVGLALVVGAYFVKSKRLYLFLQASCMLCMVVAYFFILEFFAMLSLAVALTRTITYYMYERSDKRAPVWLAFAFSACTLAVFIIVNIVILKDAKPIDIICLATQILYTFIFRIRNLKLVRYLVCAPTVLGTIYNIAINAPISVLIYAFEFGANVVAMLKFQTIPYVKEYLKNKRLNEQNAEQSSK